jgi:hypothetical protein
MYTEKKDSDLNNEISLDSGQVEIDLMNALDDLRG